jgi:hypothetical protein
MLALSLVAAPALAQAAIEVTRGPVSEVYGSCMPTLTVTNRSGQTIDYLQVDLMVRFRGGREARAELKSAYRYGVLRPIAPGASATLHINPDEAMPLGAPCSEIDAMQAVTSICEAAAGDCSAALKVEGLQR